MLSVRLNKSLENQLNYFSKLNAIRKTNVVKEALQLYFQVQNDKPKKSAYELGEHLFGLADSGQTNLSTNYKTRLKEKLNEKYSLNR